MRVLAICAFMFTFPNTGSYRLLKLIGETKCPQASGMCVCVSVGMCVFVCVRLCASENLWGKKIDEKKK